MKAVVSVTFDEIFVVHDIKVIEGEKGLFIAMPSRRSGDGEYRDIAHPINSEMRDKLQKEILEKYKLIKEILNKNDCFLNMSIEYAYAILRDLGVSEEKLKSVYLELI